MSSSHTYFLITGDFDPKEICSKLNVVPKVAWKSNDPRQDGKPYGFSSVEICYCDQFDMIVSKQMEKTIAPLSEEISILNTIREKYNLDYSLCAVVEIEYKTDGVYDTPTPCLSPSLAVMDFCTKVRAELDIDYYIV